MRKIKCREDFDFFVVCIEFNVTMQQVKQVEE